MLAEGRRSTTRLRLKGVLPTMSLRALLRTFTLVEGDGAGGEAEAAASFKGGFDGKGKKHGRGAEEVIDAKELAARNRAERALMRKVSKRLRKPCESFLRSYA